MQSDLCFTLEDALKSLVRGLGGAKAVGHKLRPDFDPDAAGRWLLDCLNAERSEKLSLSQLMLLLRWGHDAGVHCAIDFVCRDTGYTEPQPITPADEADALMREFVEATKLQAANVAKLERLAKLAAARKRAA